MFDAHRLFTYKQKKRSHLRKYKFEKYSKQMKTDKTDYKSNNVPNCT